jgi:hypothetical protein
MSRAVCCVTPSGDLSLMGAVCSSTIRSPIDNHRKLSLYSARETSYTRSRSSLDDQDLVSRRGDRTLHQQLQQVLQQLSVTYVPAIPAGTRGCVLTRSAWEQKMKHEGRIVVEDRQFAIGGFCRSVPVVGGIENSSILTRRLSNTLQH